MKFKEWLEGTRATLYTQSAYKGASVDDRYQDEQPVMLNIEDIVNFEPAGKMQQPESQENMRAMVDAIQKGESSYIFKGQQRQITPILVRRVDNLRGISNPRWNGRIKMSQGGVSNSQYKYQVVDGHHRYWAYKMAGVKLVPAIIIAADNISFYKA